jgi:hypothetical protein
MCLDVFVFVVLHDNFDALIAVVVVENVGNILLIVLFDCRRWCVVVVVVVVFCPIRLLVFFFDSAVVAVTVLVLFAFVSDVLIDANVITVLLLLLPLWKLFPLLSSLSILLALCDDVSVVTFCFCFALHGFLVESLNDDDVNVDSADGLTS